MTVSQILRQAARKLAAVAGAAARLEAEVLLAEARGQSRSQLLADLHEEVSVLEQSKLEGMAARRLAGEPLAYVLCRREFMSLEFRVTPAVLIPRPETETLVEAALEILRQEGWTRPRVVDVGTGCGNIALSLAYYGPPLEVVALDVSAAALAVARANARRLGLAHSVSFCRGNLLEPLIRGHLPGQVEMVVANLPYVTSEELAGLAPEVRREPRLALDGGCDGLELYRRLLDQAPMVLRAGGFLLVEMSPPQAEALRAAFTAAGFTRLRQVTDVAGRERVLSGRLG